MFGRTVSDELLQSDIPIALGTDSALTFPGDLADELRTARERGVTRDSLYRMVTSTAASILRLRDGSGSIRQGGVADLIAVADHGQTPAEALLDLRPNFVMIGGRIKLLSGIPDAGKSLKPIHVDGLGEFLVDADVSYLHEQARKALGPEYRLAGRRVAA